MFVATYLNGNLPNNILKNINLNLEFFVKSKTVIDKTIYLWKITILSTWLLWCFHRVTPGTGSMRYS